MKALALAFLLLVAACSHDEKPAQNTPDVSADPTIPPTATAMPAAATTSADAGHSPCDAVRCKGGMVCKMVSGAPSCVAP